MHNFILHKIKHYVNAYNIVANKDIPIGIRYLCIYIL